MARLAEAVEKGPRSRYERYQREEQSLLRKVEKLERQAENLANAIAEGGRMNILLERLESVNEELASARRLLSRRKAEAVERGDVPTRESLESNLESAIISLAERSIEFGPFMRRILPEFLIQPVQALDSGQVRPATQLKIDLSIGSGSDPGKTEHGTLLATEISLFEPPVHIAAMEACVKRKERNPDLSLRRIASELGINYMTVKRALSYHRCMRAEGLVTPYRKLEERPVNASRWAGLGKRT